EARKPPCQRSSQAIGDAAIEVGDPSTEERAHLVIGRDKRSVLVSAADPHLERVALVPSLWRAVENPVVAHQELDPAGRRPVGLVEGAAVRDECAEPK